MTASRIAASERAYIADLLLDAGPGAPTLCEGWTTHDLAAHLWVREQDPIAAPGILIEKLAGVTEARMQAVKDRWTYQELVDRVRTGPHGLSPFRLPGLGGQANALEYFIHAEDVRRAQPCDVAPREFSPAVNEWLWSRVGSMGRMLARSIPVGLAAEWPAADGVGRSKIERVKAGTPIVTIVGEPGEILMYLYGRTDHADVELIGTDAALEALAASPNTV